ncbi:TPA: hypothetical protein PMB70_003184 [Vibrio cholerae]|nr:hypothetical protein [Vibrio cholerae]
MKSNKKEISSVNILNVCNDALFGSLSTRENPVNGQRARQTLRFNVLDVKNIQAINTKNIQRES